MNNITKILICWIFANICFAQDGKIVFLKGEIKINGVKSKMGAPISYGDEIETLNKALAIIKVNPKTSLKLKSNTKVTIEKPTKNKLIESYSYVLKGGEMFVKATKTQDKDYKVKSNHITFGVRGTQFFVTASKDKKSWMCVNEGIVQVSLEGQKRSVEVKAGQGVKIFSNLLPEVKEYPWTKKLNWEMQGSFDQIDDKVNINELNYDIEELNYE